MSVTSRWYASAMSQAFGSALDFTAGEVKCALLGSGYVPDRNAHVFFSDLTNEVVGAGYVPGGIDVAGMAITEADMVTSFLMDDVVFDPVTVTARYAVFYVWTGVAATSPLLWLVDFGTDQVRVADDVTIQIDPEYGIAAIAAA